MTKQVDKLEHNAAAIKRWRSRLKRAMSMLDKLERQRKRLEARPVKLTENIGSTTWARPATMLAEIDPPPPLKSDDLTIPQFLQRKKPDPVAEQIKAEQEATKKAKARGQAERRKAKQRGDLKKMPLTGKAALAAIQGQ